MPETSEAAPRFEYDQATLRARGENVLDAVARCLTDGPLKNETITLIGRTDPRGTEQYNDALAQSRAAAARNYLVARGVPSARILLVSRGEQGARGTDEATWALDRRVDLELGNRSAPASTASRDSTASPIMKGTKLQIETSRSKREEHPNALSYSDTAEGGTPVSGGSKSSSSGSGSGDMSSSSSGEVKGSASGSVDVSAGTHR